MKSLIQLFLCLLVAGGIVACGQKGGLTLPDETPATQFSQT